MKLIIINGTPASGKSTLAKRICEEVPLTLNVAVDNLRSSMSDWRVYKGESQTLAYNLALGVAETHLKSGNSVVVDKAIVGAEHRLDQLIALGNKYGAEIYEFILTADCDVIVQRATDRGFNPNGLLNPDRVVELWEQSQELIKKRDEAILVDTNGLDAEAVYLKVKNIIFK